MGTSVLPVLIRLVRGMEGLSDCLLQLAEELGGGTLSSAVHHMEDCNVSAGVSSQVSMRLAVVVVGDRIHLHLHSSTQSSSALPFVSS